MRPSLAVLPVLLLAVAPAARAGKPKLHTVRVLEWAPPLPPWRADGFQLSASQAGVEVKVTFLPPGARGPFFREKTGVAEDPFANDGNALFFQLEIVNAGSATFSVAPGQFSLSGGGNPDGPWRTEDYLLKFKTAGPTESARLHRLYLMEKVELAPGTKLNRAIVFGAQSFLRQDGFLLSTENLPVVAPDGRALALFRMRYVKRKVDDQGRPVAR